jgi:hypothetical protein
MTEMPFEEGRYVDDDGNELNPDLIAKPALCVSCAKDGNGDPEEEVLCNLTRLDQDGDSEFQCFGYEPKKGD